MGTSASASTCVQKDEEDDSQVGLVISPRTCDLDAMVNPVVAWILSIMIQVAPPAKLVTQPQLPGWEETEQQKLARYHSIAEDLYHVVYDPNTKPLYKSENGRAITAATLLAIAFHESGFAHDVDKGPCYRGKDGRWGRCDGGLSATLMQIRLGEEATTKRVHGVDGLKQKDLFADRKQAFRVGLHLVHRSFVACSKNGPDLKLAGYASGNCAAGHTESNRILHIARRFVADKSKVPGPDTAYIRESE